MEPTTETPLQKARMLPDSIEAIEALRRLATNGFYEPQLDENNDVIGIVVHETLWDGPVTPEMAEAGIDQEVVGTETTIVANLAWDRDGNELERIEANAHYLCRLHNVFPRIVARLRSAEADCVDMNRQIGAAHTLTGQWINECGKRTEERKAVENRVHEIALLLDKTINRLIEDCDTATFDQAQAYRSHVGVLVKFQEEAGLVMRASPQQEKPRPMPTKEALAQALTARYGGRPIEAAEILDSRDFSTEGDADTTVHFQAWRNAMIDWYEVIVNSAGQVDHTSITQLPF